MMQASLDYLEDDTQQACGRNAVARWYQCGNRAKCQVPGSTLGSHQGSLWVN